MDKVPIQLGSLEQIIQEHGSNAAAINLALATGKATMADMIKIRNKLDALERRLEILLTQPMPLRSTC